jgi:hypothetical protein
LLDGADEHFSFAFVAVRYCQEQVKMFNEFSVPNRKDIIKIVASLCAVGMSWSMEAQPHK